MKQPFYIDDLAELREKLSHAEDNGELMGRVWNSVKRRARKAPKQFPWFTPFVALITGDKDDIENAKNSVRNYVATMDPQSFGMGLQFHFWCFAFPHARWSLYFHWLAGMGAWEPEEEKEIREALLTFQYINFFYGMRTKPEPECVDNQTMSLCFSNALLGHLFNESSIAQRMYTDGIRRLPSLIGGMPPSGYSGEGSTYMDAVVGPSIPFIVELLERTEGGDWFSKTLPPAGGNAQAICRMIAREWMPNGLLLPWDHYGYAQPVRSCVAYAAHRSADPFYGELLEQQANWAVDQSIGWGFDDLIWSLIWWPTNNCQDKATFKSWCEPEVGAALISDDAKLYLMQMWDESAPHFPTRAHVNPNAIVLTAYGSPLTVDGVPDKDCTAFNYDDTWREVSFMDLGTSRKFNFGVGCGGGHSVILVDKWEGMRAFSEYPQSTLIAASLEEKSVITDVTPIYKERFTDAITVRRRSRLVEERFWLIEDMASFTQPHEVGARFFLRPQQIDAQRGISVETAEGVRLSLLPLVGPDSSKVTPIKGYPERLDGESLLVDFTQQGKECRWLWLAFPEATREVVQDVSGEWNAVPDAEKNLDIATIQGVFSQQATMVSLTVPPYMQRNLPVIQRWWFRRTINVPAAPASWLRLPKQMFNLQLWINGEIVDLSSHTMRMNLLEPEIELPAKFSGSEIEVTVCCDTGDSQYGPDGHEGSGFYGKPVILVAQDAPGVEFADYQDNTVIVRSGKNEWIVKHNLMEI